MKDFEKLYYLHKEELYRYLFGLTHDPEQAGDLMQETFLQAMLGIGRFRQESSVRTWLFAIGRNLWLKEMRKRRETVEYDDLLDTQPGCAKRVVDLCQKAGVIMTPAGATYPYGVDPDDTNIRIAPTYPTLEELEPAARILCLCVKIATIEKMIAQTSEKETAPQAPYAIAQ